jgi:tight adherence protein C
MPLLIITVLVFIGITSLLFFLIYVVMPRKTVLEERVESLTPTPSVEIRPFETQISSWQKFLGRLGKNVPMRPQDYGKYQKMLVAAGLKKERVGILMGSKLLLAVILPLTYLVLYGIPVEKELSTKILITVASTIAGFLLPTYWLRSKLQKRQLTIFHDLPDLLDLMTVCVEAGLSMDAAMIKVCDDQQFKRSPLAREITIATQETRAGKPRLEALRDMGERTMVDDLKSFAAMLIQTEKLGTSLAQSLRVFSDSLRTIRRQRAEEAAAKTAVKLVFPLVFFIFPAILVVILGPAIIRISKFFTEM